MNNDDILIKIFNKVTAMEEKMVTKDEFQKSRSELVTHIDGFIKLHETLDTELVALRSKYDRLENRVQQIEMKVGIAEA